MFVNKKILMPIKNLSYLLLIIIAFASCSSEKTTEISLEGQWHVRLDSTGIGEKENWASEKFDKVPMALPGTLDDAGLGIENVLEPALNNYVLSHLTRKHQYYGPAWYQREITIPEDWENKEIELKLERVIWESQVYVDGRKVQGFQESLIAPHYFDLTEVLTPGKHTLTIRIDNSDRYPLINVHGSKYPDSLSKDMAHAYTNHTQIKWNGIIGDLLLTASSKVYPENVQVFPDIENDHLLLKLQIGNESGEAWLGKMNYSIKTKDGKELISGIREVELGSAPETIELLIPTENKLEPWDEFHPVLYSLNLTLESDKGDAFSEDLKVTFGVREVANENGILTLNDQRIFLRGNLECAIFPLTGYPYTEKEGWQKMIKTAKSYGLNHLRFHSWCPPKAAFEAADEAGFYLQVEAPHWSDKVGVDEATTNFIKDELDKILAEYGNHPSLLLLSLGNELKGDAALMNNMVKELKEKDGRHLYTTTSFTFQKGMGKYPQPQDDFLVTQYTDKGWIRGQGIFNTHPPHFNEDYSDVIDSIQVPLISHEIGQYSVFPDLNEIEKYTGVLEPLNFIAIRNDLEKKGLIDLADEFTQASGKLAAMLYKEEIERALKTPGFDGFQLLQLQDFPGQGTALVGLLNAFWESKGIISPEEFREFNGEIVPLLQFEKAVYTSGEIFQATAEVANYFKVKNGVSVAWQIKDEKGHELAGGEFEGLDLEIGNNKSLGKIQFPVETDTAKRLTVSLSIPETPYKNSWPVWIYPEEVNTKNENMVITESFEVAERALKEGKNVLLNPSPESLTGIIGRFVPVFWSPVHFPNQPGTMGILCDPAHPALQQFPTSFHTEWQWWDLCINSKSLIVDSLEVKPIVRVIDNFVTNHHLTNLFEAKVGKGKLIFSSIDIQSDLQNRPVARQLLHSLISYMDSKDFNPEKKADFEALKNKLKSN